MRATTLLLALAAACTSKPASTNDKPEGEVEDSKDVMAPGSCTKRYRIAGSGGIAVAASSWRFQDEQAKQLALKNLTDTTKWKLIEGLGDLAGSQESPERSVGFVLGNRIVFLQVLGPGTHGM